MSNVLLVYVTASSFEESEKIAAAVVTEKLAACANILPQATSLFEWDGKLCREEETVLILKTTERQTDGLMARIKELHSYECPCIVCLSIDAGNPDFLQWVDRQTSAN